ncbi:hypothetical protein K435DRAFT_795080 [Dendrothele bispora CBS 962.96]|uniref:Glutathione S-transferase UstS-like C-terminal domain-containing protein n=1 Tax=Dendrothele bispora (strain CBS 962.96) TaxID=1314807 RepID=A0A4S8M9U3_DENBC|nr:hypothetical protein K435DRAFT_795080 [Dendrothele bispora CBS 962.96]
MSDNAILFDDIPSKSDTGILWSPNTWKVRYILNYKRIPYQTVMLGYPDIEPTMKKVGNTNQTFKMEDLYPRGEQKVIEWRKVEAAFNKEDGLIMGRGSETPAPTFAEFALGAYMMWLKAIFEQQSEDSWEAIVVKQNSGRWGKFLKMLEKYEQF